MKSKMLKCGCVASSTHQNEHDGLKADHPSCIIHDCCEVVETPNLDGRKARCTFYGKPVKKGSYNGCCCTKCDRLDICQCEEPSSTSLWFFQLHPDKEFDEYYCACHGAD